MRTIMFVTSATASILFFNFIFNKLNYKYKLFEEIKNKIKNLHEKKNRKLRVISYASIIVIIVIIENNISSTIQGFIFQGLAFGLLLSFRNIFFEDAING